MEKVVGGVGTGNPISCQTVSHASSPGNPAANTMQASINMNGNTISGLPVIGAGSCNAAGAIGVYNNAVVVCEGGQWQTQSSGSQWGAIKQSPNMQHTGGGGLDTGGGAIKAGQINGTQGQFNQLYVWSCTPSCGYYGMSYIGSAP